MVQMIKYGTDMQVGLMVTIHDWNNLPETAESGILETLGGEHLSWDITRCTQPDIGPPRMEIVSGTLTTVQLTKYVCYRDA